MLCLERDETELSWFSMPEGSNCSENPTSVTRANAKSDSHDPAFLFHQPSPATPWSVLIFRYERHVRLARKCPLRASLGMKIT